MPGKGPPPKPTALKILEGRPGHSKPNRAEPQYQATMNPARPVGMSRGAIRFWNEYVASMGMSGVLTVVDGPGLAALCEDQAVMYEMRRGWRAMEAQMRKGLREKKQRELINPTTVMARSPEGRRMLSSMSTLTTQIIAREREFGLMPGSRSRVEVAPGIGGRRMDSIEAALCG